MQFVRPSHRVLAIAALVFISLIVMAVLLYFAIYERLDNIFSPNGWVF